MSGEDDGVKLSEEEQKASKGGWQPQENWKGDPDLWVDAQTFNERGEQILPIVKKQNAELREQINTLTGELETVKNTAAEFRKFQKAEINRQKVFYDQQISDLKVLRKQAINESDGDQVTLIEDQIDEAKTAKAGIEAPPAQPTVDPKQIEKMVEEWAGENEWYSSQANMKEYAEMYSRSIVNPEDPEFQGRKLLDKVSKKVKEMFPGYFVNPNRERESLGDGAKGGGDGGGGGTGRTFADLPADAKKQFKEFKDLMPDYKKEDYATAYFAQGDD